MKERHPPQIQPLIAITVAAVLFVLLSAAMLHGRLQALDVAGVRAVDTLRGPLADMFFPVVTWVGSSMVLLPACIVLGLRLWNQHRRVVPLLLMAPVGALVLQNVLRPLFSRTRPEAGILAELGPGFPSGHSLTATGVWIAVVYMLAREGLVHPAGRYVALLVAFLVGLSRVYLGVHWPTDVMAGWCVGVILASALIIVYERQRQTRMHTLS